LRKKVADPMSRLLIDLDCYIVTPLHKMIGRLREVARGNSRFGSTGQGVGIAARDVKRLSASSTPSSSFSTIVCLRIRDLLLEEDQLAVLVDAHVKQKMIEARTIIERYTLRNGAVTTPTTKLSNDIDDDDQLDIAAAAFVATTSSSHGTSSIASSASYDANVVIELTRTMESFSAHKEVTQLTKWYHQFGRIYRNNLVNGLTILTTSLKNDPCVVFEGAQGALLDPNYGFYPFITKTPCTPTNALSLLDETKVPYDITRIGNLFQSVSTSYLTHTYK
jgi:adenylosuccinate synthase